MEISRAPDSGPVAFPRELQPPEATKRIARWLKWGMVLSIPLIFVYGIGLLGIALCAVGLVMHFFFFRTQASLLEVMLTLSVSSIPLGLTARFVQQEAIWFKREEFIQYVGFGCMGFFPMLMIFAGSVWGFSAARRLGERRTWPRLGLMVLGWCLVFGMPLLIVMPIASIPLVLSIGEALFDPRVTNEAWPEYALFLLAGWAMVWFVVYAIRVERRCRARAGAENL